MVKLENISSDYLKKYLQRGIVRSPESESDRSQEVIAVLETVKQFLLLHPQAIYTLALKAKNAIIQIGNTCSSLLNNAILATEELENKTDFPKDISDLLEAKSALLSLNSIEADKAFERYNASVERYLKTQLSPLVRPKRKQYLERSGDEAREDLIDAVRIYLKLRKELENRINLLISAESSFTSLKLQDELLSGAVEKVIQSLDELRFKSPAGAVSNITSVIELLAGKAAITSLRNPPAINESTLPADVRAYPVMGSPSVSTTAVVGSYSINALPTDYLTVEVDGGAPQTIQVPSQSVASTSSSFYLASSKPSTVFNIPNNTRLYLYVEGINYTHSDPSVGTQNGLVPVSLSAGSIPFSQVVSEIDTGSPSFIRCVELGEQGAPSGSSTLLIYTTDPNITSISVQTSAPYPVTGGVVQGPPPDSIHEELGFGAGQAGVPNTKISPETLQASLSASISGVNVTVSDTLDYVTISTYSIGPSASLKFSGTLAAELGLPFSLIQDESSVVELRGDISSLTPDSKIILNGVSRKVVSIDRNTNLVTLDQPIHTDQGLSVVVEPKPKYTMLPLISYLRQYSAPSEAEIDGKLSSVLGNPSEAFRSDFINLLNSAKDSLDTLVNNLRSLATTEVQDPLHSQVEEAIHSLEERGMDRAVELLIKCDFVSFSSMIAEESSFGSNLLSKMETIGKDIPANETEKDWESADDQTAFDMDRDTLPLVEQADEEDIVDGR